MTSHVCIEDILYGEIFPRFTINTVEQKTTSIRLVSAGLKRTIRLRVSSFSSILNPLYHFMESSFLHFYLRRLPTDAWVQLPLHSTCTLSSLIFNLSLILLIFNMENSGESFVISHRTRKTAERPIKLLFANVIMFLWFQ